MPGDGIGKVVLEETLRVLEAGGFSANYIEGDIGWEFWCKEGNPLPQRTIDLIAKHKIALLDLHPNKTLPIHLSHFCFFLKQTSL